MGKGFGIAALVFAIMSIFIPGVALYVAWLALMLAAVGAFAGNLGATTAAVVICLVNIVFLSPLTLAVLLNAPVLKYGTVILFILPVVGFVVARKRKPSVLPT